MKSFTFFANKLNRRWGFQIVILLQLSLFLVQFQLANAQSSVGSLITRSCEDRLTANTNTLDLRLSAIDPNGTVQSINGDNLTVDIEGKQLNKDLITFPPETPPKNRIFVVYENTLSMSDAKLSSVLKDSTFISRLLTAYHRVNLVTFDITSSAVIPITTPDIWLEKVLANPNTANARISRMDLAIETALDYARKEKTDLNEKDVLLLITDSLYPNNTEQTLIDEANNQGITLFAIAIATPRDTKPDIAKLENMADKTGGFIWSNTIDKIDSAASDFSNYVNEFLKVIDDPPLVEINLQGIQFNQPNPKLNFSVKISGQPVEKSVDADCSDKLSFQQNNDNFQLIFQDPSLSSLSPEVEYYFDDLQTDKRSPPVGITLIPIDPKLNRSVAHIIHITVTDSNGRISTVAGIIPPIAVSPTLTVTPTAEVTLEATSQQPPSSEAANPPSSPPQDIPTPLLMSVVLLAVDYVLFRQVRQARVRYMISHPDAFNLVTMNVTVKHSNSQPNQPLQLTKKTVFVGRSDENDIQLMDDSQTVSRQHGVLIWRNQGWYYSNLKPAQTAFVDNKKITGLHLIKVQDYTEIKIGDNLLIFHKGSSPLKQSDMMRTNFQT